MSQSMGGLSIIDSERQPAQAPIRWARSLANLAPWQGGGGYDLHRGTITFQGLFGGVVLHDMGGPVCSCPLSDAATVVFCSPVA